MPPGGASVPFVALAVREGGRYTPRLRQEATGMPACPRFFRRRCRSRRARLNLRQGPRFTLDQLTMSVKKCGRLIVAGFPNLWWSCVNELLPTSQVINAIICSTRSKAP